MGKHDYHTLCSILAARAEIVDFCKHGLVFLAFGSRESETFGDSVLGVFAGEYKRIMRDNPNQPPVEHLIKLWVRNYYGDLKRGAPFTTPDSTEYVACLHACMPQPDCGLAFSLFMLSKAYPRLVAKQPQYEKAYTEFMIPLYVFFKPEGFETLNALFNHYNPNYRRQSPFPLGGEKGWETAKQLGLAPSVPDINTRDESGETALMQASKSGHLEVIKLLLAKGADANAKSKDGTTALIHAAQRGHTDVVKQLQERDANINMENTVGETALMLAAQRGHVEIARFLFDKGADINAKTIHGTTPFMMAAVNGHVEAVKFLLANNADAHARTKDGLTALHAALNAPSFKTVRARGVIATMLKQAGATE